MTPLPYQPPRAAREQDRARRERTLDKWCVAVIVAGIVGAYVAGYVMRDTRPRPTMLERWEGR